MFNAGRMNNKRERDKKNLHTRRSSGSLRGNISAQILGECCFDQIPYNGLYIYFALSLMGNVRLCIARAENKCECLHFPFNAFEWDFFLLSKARAIAEAEEIQNNPNGYDGRQCGG